MKKERLDIHAPSRGYAEVVDMALNGSWATIEFIEYSRRGFAKRQLRITVDLYDLTEIARKAHAAVAANTQHAERLRLRALGEGY